jgi:hypothetical protein
MFSSHPKINSDLSRRKMMTMNAKEITKKAMDFQKGAFDCWWDALSVVQDQAALAVETMLNQMSSIPDEDRRVISGWVGACKNERNRYRGYMEESFSAFEKHLAADTKDASARPDQPTAEAKTADPELKSKADAVESKKAPADRESM